MKLRKICHTSFALTILATIYIILEVYMLETTLAISNILLRYVSAIIIGFGFEKYLSIPALPLIKKPNSLLKVWIMAALFYGAIFWGVGVGTFVLLFMHFVLGMSNTSSSSVVFTYIIMIIGGFILGNLLFFILLGINSYIKNHRLPFKVTE